MKNAKVFISVLLMCGLLFLSSFPASRGPLSLIKIPKGPGFPVYVLSRLQVDVRQELGSCLLALADRFLDAASSYGPLGATKTVDASFVYSDHAPFWDGGYPALLAIEDDPLQNPYYHNTTDALDKINLDFFTSATRASVGLLAELAQPLREGYPKTPKGLAAAPVVYSALFSAFEGRPRDLERPSRRGRIQSPCSAGSRSSIPQHTTPFPRERVRPLSPMSTWGESRSSAESRSAYSDSI